MKSTKLLRILIIFTVAILAQACSQHSYGKKCYGKKSDCSYYKLKEKCEKGCSESCAKVKEMKSKYACGEGKKDCGCMEKSSCKCSDCDCKDKGLCECKNCDCMKEKSCCKDKKEKYSCGDKKAKSCGS